LKLNKNNFLDIFSTNLKSYEDYFIATYEIKTNPQKGDVLQASYELAIGQSIGNPYSRSIHEESSLITNNSCIILHDPNELENKYEMIINIAFPNINIDFQNDGISQLLCMLMGGQMDIETFEKCRLVDIKFSKNIERFFYKPVYGLSGMRNKVNSYDKPLFGSIIKPKTGINKIKLLDMVKQLIDGGVDFIKEDEILSNPHFCSLKERVPLITNYLEKNNIKIIYTFCINSDHDEIINRSRFIVNEGGHGIHINWWAGLGVYRSIKKLNLPLFIHFQKSGDKVITHENHNFGIDWKVICSIAALSGVDSIHVGMLGGYLNDDETKLKKISIDLSKKNTIPALSCGLNSKSIPVINKAIGTDYLANVGGAVHSNPEGSTKGAKLMRDTIDQYTNIK
tara:strand:+ start:3044 stop:4231 length:1188 start_codon:yes stop_codon:yes gene_type:complete